ncbi:hypothetical protein [Nocardia sp. NPDC057668]|uniref:hypothetical protein n=1 Tax=Nocardia sp. NPDC057668 TaxID=3346202 RepID=UPI00366A5991
MRRDSGYDTFEFDTWERLAALLPSDRDAGQFRDCREIGEQEAGLQLLTHSLLEHQVPITDRTRVEIEVLAEHWGERFARHDEIAMCVRASEQDASIRLLPDKQVEPFEPSEVGITDPATARMVVIPWFECLGCSRVVARVHTRQPWGEFLFQAERYLVLPRSGDAATGGRLFRKTELLDAFALLLTCS